MVISSEFQPKEAYALARETAAPESAVAAVAPPPVRRGKKGVEIATEILDAFKALIEKGEYAGDGKTYDSRAAANKAIVDYKKALKAHWPECPELTSRTWEGEGDDTWLIALKDKNAKDS